MIKASTWKEKFKITHFFVDPDGLASIQGLAYCLQETAVNHAASGSFGYEQLIREQKAWVLTRQHIVLKKIPVVSQKITIESWVADTQETFSIRDYHILDTNDQLLGLARTSWMMFDLKARKPVKIMPTLKNNFPHLPGHIAEELPLNKILPPGDEKADETAFTVCYSDLDVNHHVNNIHYLRWVLDDFDYDFRKINRLYAIESNFLSEAFYGEELKISTFKDPDEPLVFITTIRHAYRNRLILSSRTKWVKK